MKVGVIIGRFQVPELTTGHQELINKVAKENDGIIFLVGQGDERRFQRYPLDFDTVKEMIHETYPDVRVERVDDQDTDETWSHNVDGQIDGLASELSLSTENITLYGGRDSFIPHYIGKYTTTLLMSEKPHPSGTEVRAGISYPLTKEGREGAIWAAKYHGGKER